MPPPDLILHGGKIITLDRSSRLAQAVSVRSGHVVAVGDDATLLKDAARDLSRRILVCYPSGRSHRLRLPSIQNDSGLAQGLADPYATG
jgi:hypothetical protein